MRFAAAVFSVCLTTLLAIGTLSGANAEAPDPSGKVDGVLAQSGYKYKQLKPTVWIVPVTLDKLGERPVIISANSDLVVTFLIVAESKDIKKTPELMQALLQTNNDYDFVKVGFDSGGDLFVRIDSPLRNFDVEKLKTDVEQVKRVSDAVSAQTK